MGLYDKLTKGGTPFSITGNGATPATNPLSTSTSKMHYNYSIAGTSRSIVSKQYKQYVDGANNNLPQPSQLDVNGVTPTSALKDPTVKSINDSFSKGQYLNNLPR